MGKRFFVFLALAAIIIVGLFYFLKSNPQLRPTTGTAPSTTNQLSTSKVFTLVVKNKQLVSGPETIQVTQGDDVDIKITSDLPEELHLHGYDKSLDLEASQEAELKFQANLTGHFEYELEKSQTPIGALEVQPK